ncbi:hypothetical protein DMENIID0001_169610 [Sergentomyia squamirostris]
MATELIQHGKITTAAPQMIRNHQNIITSRSSVNRTGIYYLIRHGSAAQAIALVRLPTQGLISADTIEPPGPLDRIFFSKKKKKKKKRKMNRKFFTPDKIVCYVMSVMVIVAATAAIIMVVRTSICDSKEVEIPEQKPMSATWGYRCIEGKCHRTLISTDNWINLDSLSVCHLKCEKYATLLPHPTGQVHIGRAVETVSLCRVDFTQFDDSSVQKYLTASIDRFHRVLEWKRTKDQAYAKGSRLAVQFNLTSMDLSLNRDTDECYSLKVDFNSEWGIRVAITGETYYGIRHGLETLAQLIVYDDLQVRYKVPSDVEIVDCPVYGYRGLLLDTVRQYYSLDSIKRTIDTMAMVKLNVFHWHITDSNSYPMKLNRFPEMAQIGAYSPDRVYTPADMRDVVEFARIRGIRVIPEYDAPAHVAEGWQLTDLITCYNGQPYYEFCAGPPCGQLDPTQEQVYGYLESIYAEMNEIFNFPDMFHMGGDEVYPSCWNSSVTVRQWMTDRGWTHDRDGYIQLWDYFQAKAHEKLMKASQGKTKAILWTGTLTEEAFVDRFLSPADYIIQVWTLGSGPTSQIPHLLERGYDLIISNNDALYLDCGFGLYVDEGVNWCSPYKPWTKIYGNNITAMAGEYRGQILGAEACSWSSINGEPSLDSRLWPRLSALAERLWTDPDTNFRQVERRILHHLRDLINAGIDAESIQPEWCIQNPHYCLR